MVWKKGYFLVILVSMVILLTFNNLNRQSDSEDTMFNLQFFLPTIFFNLSNLGGGTGIGDIPLSNM